MTVRLPRWMRLRKRTLRGGHDPVEMQRRSVEARRRRKLLQEIVPAVSLSAGHGGELSRGRPDWDSQPLLTGPHTNPVRTATIPTETPADRRRAGYEAHLAAKPKREPVSPEEARYASYGTLDLLAARLDCPAEGESQGDWSIRRQLVMDVIWERKLRHNGTLEIPTMPRYFPNPEQWFM
jgi:hypothetical protein